MRHLLTLVRHEIRLLLISPTVYIASVIFLILMGFIYWAILREMTLAPQDISANAQFFGLFWLPVFFLVPLLTMRSIAAEKSRSTLESLFSTPVPKFSIILSKYLSAYLLYITLWALTLYFPIITQSLFPETISNNNLVDPAGMLGGIIFIALSGLLFIAIGIFASSLTRSQLVAAMLCFTLLLIACIGSQQLEYATFNYLSPGSFLYGLIEYINIYSHLEDFSLGIIDTRPFVFYFSSAYLFLSLAVNNIESKL